jgi:hypothetical protein
MLAIQETAMNLIKTPAQFTLLAAAAIALSVCLTACQPTLECGTWNFSGTPTGTAFPLSSAFTFTPSTCGQNCQSSEDVMIQMVWVYDENEHKNVYASDEPQGGRSDADGWSIDRIDSAAYGYYGLQNNGTFLSFWNIPGSPGTANTLFDEPSGWGANTYFYAVDVAVCYNSRDCNNKILGYYFWSYILNSSDVGEKLITAPAWKDLDTEFQSAIAAWNTWAPTSGTEDDGTGTFSHAIAFPTLTQL